MAVQRGESSRKHPATRGKRGNVLNDAKLWKIFSEYIRLRDANEHGYCICCTSGQYVHWKDCDAGHFISRRHMATKYHEKNVHAQGRFQNRFNQGEQYEYGIFIDRKYGNGTAEMLVQKSRMPCKIGQFEIDQMAKYYSEKVKEIRELKGL